jgi:nickel superoxide dismutase
MMKKVLGIVSGIAVVLLAAPVIYAHCQVPCGIHTDELRFGMFEEHITTIEKSMTEIKRLSQEGEKNYNQIVRWVTNKDYHADEFSAIVTYYFMAQRVKPVGPENAAEYGAYVRKLTLLHEMMVYAMKAKQDTDVAVVEKLRSLVTQFREAYFGPKAAEER